MRRPSTFKRTTFGKLVLLIKLLGVRWKRRREINRKYFPTVWRTQPGIAYQYVHAYFRYEGKGKEQPLDLLNKFYGSLKDVQDGLKTYLTISTFILVYSASFALNLEVPISFTGISFKYDLTVLAAATALNGYLGLRSSEMMGHALILRAAIRSIIDQSFDPQLGESLKSAFLHHQGAAFYTPQSNPLLIRKFSNRLILFLMSPTYILVILAVLAAPLLVNIKIAIRIIETPSDHYTLNVVLLIVTLLFYGASFLALVLGAMPQLYKDWANNTKFELLSQLDPVEHRRFGSEVYGGLVRVNYAIEKVRTRLGGNQK